MILLHKALTDVQLKSHIKHKNICFAGNMQLKIYGRLNCASGKRMKKANRIFFSSAGEAAAEGYRPCGNCMKEQYKLWRNGPVQ